MNFLDFGEIPHDGDTFEAFAYRFLFLFGYAPDTTPSNGPDGGRDGIVRDPPFGPAAHGVRWLVSCKHQRSHVGVNDDHPDHLKLLRHGCNGFLRVYSSVWTSGLQAAFEDVTRRHGLQIVVFGPYEIEAEVLANTKYAGLVRQYMPQSFNRLVAMREGLEVDCCQTFDPEYDDRYLIVYQDSSGQQHGDHCCENCRSYLEDSLHGSGVRYDIVLTQKARRSQYD